VPLLRTCSGIDQTLGANDRLPPLDYYIPLLSLPGVFKTDLETIPAHVPYLSADPALVDRWRTKLASIRGFRIGINWQGLPGNADFCLRDMPLESLTTLADISGVQLISLQKGAARDELLASPNRHRIHQLGPEFDETGGAFLDTAAVMRNLDLVITSDTSIAHLAGALAVPVWLGLPFVPNWRWLLDRPDSPWYPTMRLFRQKTRNDWTTVINEIRTALATLL
jgi:hypothetical protein